MKKPNQRAHASHFRDKKAGKEAGEAEGAPEGEPPSYLLHTETDGMRELLEDLDDAIFMALQGSDDSLDRAKSLWPRALAEINEELVEESREHYLRFAVEASQRIRQNEVRSPEQSVAALEIILLLTTV